MEDLAFETPPPDIAARIGVGDRLHYVMFGRAIYRELHRSLHSLGIDLSQQQFILDWGSGSARIARHLIGGLSEQQKFVGVDIDAEAVRWSNSRFGNYFSQCGLLPPLRIESNTVDLAFSYSVVTHLKKDVLALWFNEMERILKPGGIFAFTVLGETALVCLLPQTSNQEIASWKEIGISDSAENSQIDAVTQDYYKNTWITREYIEKNIGSFEILSYQPAFHFYQDLVVAKKRG